MNAINLDIDRAQSLPVLIQSHPFQSDVAHVEMPQGTAVLDMVLAAGIPERFHGFVTVFVNDTEVPREFWKGVKPKLGAQVYIRIVPQGKGGKRKNILASVLMLVVTVAASYFAPAIAGMFMSTSAPLFGLAKGAIAAGLTMLGAMAVQALIPPPEIDGNGIAGQLQLLSGVRNQFKPYAPIPRIFGKRRVYPLMAARPYTESEGKNRYLRVLLCVGFGPLKITDIKIGNVPIETYDAMEVEVLEGWTDDEFGTLPVGKTADGDPTLFTSGVYEDTINALIPGGEPGAWVTRTTDLNADEFSVDIIFPQGLARYKEDGGRAATTVEFEVEYSPTGANTWTPANWAGNDDADGTQTNGKIIAEDKSSAAVIRGGRVVLPSPGQYDVRIRRLEIDTEEDKAYRSEWLSLRTIRHEVPINQPGLAMIALRMKATDQLSGIPDTINCIAESYLPVYDGQDWNYEITRNGAWAFADVLRRRGTERMIADAKIDIPAIQAWAAANDVGAPNAAEPYWRFDAVAEGGSIFQTLRQIAAHSRSSFLIKDGKYSVVRDVQQVVPRQHITPRNSFGYTGSRAFLDRPHALRVQFTNAAQGYQQDVVTVYDDGYTEANATKFETVDFPGCPSDTQAWRDGRYLLAVGKLRPDEHSVSMDIENLRCTVGDLVQLSHDVLSIGIASARIAGLVTSGGNTTGVVLDEVVENLTGQTYVLRVRDKLGNSTLYSLAAAANDNDKDTLTLSAPVATASGPQVGDHCIYGLSGIDSAPMIITRIEPQPDLMARVLMVDAQDVYSADTGTIPAFNTFVKQPTEVAQLRPDAPVMILQSDRSTALRNTDGSITERIAVTLTPQPSSLVQVAGYEVQYRETGGLSWIAVESTPGETSVAFISGVVRGEQYDVRARAISSAGQASEWTVQSAYTALGDTTAPSTPVALTASGGYGNILLTWAANPETNISHYEVWVSETATPAPTDLDSGSFNATGTSWNHGSLGIGITRYYAIRAVNRSNLKSPWTSVVVGSTLSLTEVEGPPAIPTNLGTGTTLLADGSAKITVSWTASANSVYYDVSITQSGGNEVIFQTSGTTYEFTGLPGISYDIKVRGVNGVGGYSNWTSVATQVSATDTVAPPSITGLSSQAGFNTAWLKWTASSAVDLSHYEIYESASTTAPTAGTAATHSVASNSFVREGMSNGQTLYFWVRAVDTSGNKSAWSARQDVTAVTINEADLGDNVIVARHLTTGELLTLSAQIKDAIITDAKIANLSAAKLTAGTALANTITVNGQALGTVQTNANDPAARVNAAATKIDPGKITISGVTTLSDWRAGGDTTKIDGGNIYANSIRANSLVVGARGVVVNGLEFTPNSPSSNRVAWSAGTINWVNDSGVATTTSVSASSAIWSSGTLYVYWAKGSTSLSTTTSAATALSDNNLILATYQGGSNLVTNLGRTIIDGNFIKTGSIDATRIDATNLNVAAANITGTLSAAKINLDGLTLYNNSGALAINNNGVDTAQIKAGAAARMSYAQVTSSTDNVGQSNVWQEFLTPSPWIESDNNPITLTFLVEGNLSVTSGATHELEIRRGTTVIFTGAIGQGLGTGAQFYTSGAFTWPNPFTAGTKWSLWLRTSSSAGLQNVNGTMSVQALKKT